MNAARSLAAAAAAVVVLTAAAEPPRVREMRRPAQYFPLADGSRWDYRRVGPGGATTWTVTASAVETAAGRRWLLAGYFPGAPRRVFADGAQAVREVDPAGSDLLWYDFGAGIGSGWELRLAELPGEGPVPACIDGSKLTLAARDETVTVPAGTFTDVVRIDIAPPCADAGMTAEWFAPSVGLIRRVETSIAGPVVSELLQAAVAGGAQPRPGYTTTLALERPLLFNDLMPPVDDSSLPTLSGTFAVANRTDLPVELVFSGCRSATVTVRDERGSVVLQARADDGGCCACESLERLVLVRSSLVLPFSLRVAGDGGEPLADGWYAVDVVLDTLDPPALRPTARARVELQTAH